MQTHTCSHSMYVISDCSCCLSNCVRCLSNFPRILLSTVYKEYFWLVRCAAAKLLADPSPLDSFGGPTPHLYRPNTLEQFWHAPSVHNGLEVVLDPMRHSKPGEAPRKSAVSICQGAFLTPCHTRITQHHHVEAHRGFRQFARAYAQRALRIETRKR